MERPCLSRVFCPVALILILFASPTLLYGERPEGNDANIFIRSSTLVSLEDNIDRFWEVSGGYQFFPMNRFGLALELSFSSSSTISNHTTGLDKPGPGDLSLIRMMICAEYKIWEMGTFSQYISGAAGYSLNFFSIDDEVVRDYENLGFVLSEEFDNSFCFYLATGSELLLFESLSLNIEARYIFHEAKGNWSITDSLSDTSNSGELTQNLNTFLLFIGFRYYL